LTNFAGGRDIVAGLEQLKYRSGGFVTLPIFDDEAAAGFAGNRSWMAPE
jgi:hypothetical protein